MKNDTKENNSTEFIMPHDELQTMNKQLQNIPELDRWFAWGVAFVTYKLSDTSEAGKLMLNEFEEEHPQQTFDTIIRLKANRQNFHSCMRTTKGQFWIVPDFSIPKSKLTIGVTEIGAYVNFNVNINPSVWYVVIFKYDVTKIAIPKKGALLTAEYS